MKIKILLVDDSKNSRVYVSSILNNYTIIEAESAKEALSIIEKEQIDLLITDYNMPEMDGFDLVSTIKKNHYEFPIIIITAVKSLDKKKRMLRLGIDNYLYKPFFKEELISIIERAIVYHKTVLSSKNNLDIKIKDQYEGFKSTLEKLLYDNVDNFNFSVESMAEKFEISTKTLTRRTKAIFGQTPNQLLIECRLNVAQEIISQNPRISLKETARKVGLKNTTYLKNRLNAKFA
ncbi:DNA-binding response regulator [Polaribacter reichenbachii]|uniref:Two-component system response regulator n=1 Tax=Polaribacter reichenbachii TaxID=996801 RepID=A0A1B8TNP6_9FLAO|nr:response regulator [Polaribacter reichenbachii]APZ46686.1 DNA-binding response regulator [Polaribacter reichenbachii]AUC17329.1 DNA-binding response regulator [Polaribacter reichenbachii]OBY61222.1 two-component system response regulator [Polaribacter reichenbachii]